MKKIPQYDITEKIRKRIQNPDEESLNNAREKLLDKTLQKSLSKSKITKKKLKKGD